MKAHMAQGHPGGVDEATGRVRSVVTTAANVGNVTQVGELLYGKKKLAFGDAVDISAQRDAPAKRGCQWQIAAKRIKAIADAALHGLTEQIARIKASIRAAVEHPFRMIRRQSSQVKVRYRGPANNGAQMLTLFALSNLWTTRRHLLETTG